MIERALLNLFSKIKLTVGRRNYILAQAHVDAPALANSIAHLNTSTTFSPLQPLHDTDVAGYLRHAHEQTLISTIEESRRETQEDFYRVLEDRSRRDWEARKKRIFEELGGRVNGGAEGRTGSDVRRSVRPGAALGVSRSRIHMNSADSERNSNRRRAPFRTTCKCKARCWLTTKR
jgi:hypothetical protein